MSKHETPMTRAYWRQQGGTLIEEFRAVKKSKNSAQRLIDGVIILGGEHKIAKTDEVDIDGKDIIVVQTKKSRLGMYLIGQAIFSRLLIEKNFKPKGVRTVALCIKGDEELQRVLVKEYPEVEVVVMPSPPKTEVV